MVASLVAAEAVPVLVRHVHVASVYEGAPVRLLASIGRGRVPTLLRAIHRVVDKAARHPVDPGNHFLPGLLRSPPRSS